MEGVKEYWVNVYRSRYGTWLGSPRMTAYHCEALANKYHIYRIHVKLK